LLNPTYNGSARRARRQSAIPPMIRNNPITSALSQTVLNHPAGGAPGDARGGVIGTTLLGCGRLTRLPRSTALIDVS
jgi:hypothetical protein